MHDNCWEIESNKTICEAIDCLSNATKEIKVRAGKFVVSLNLCKNCISKFCDKDGI